MSVLAIKPASVSDALVCPSMLILIVEAGSSRATRFLLVVETCSLMSALASSFVSSTRSCDRASIALAIPVRACSGALVSSAVRIATAFSRPLVSARAAVAILLSARPPAVRSASARHVVELLAQQRPGDRVDIVVEAPAQLLGLPFEAARLPLAARPLLITHDGVTLARRPPRPPARRAPAAPGPLKLLIAIAAPDEGRTASSVLDGERELARIFDALPEHGAQAWPLEVAGLEQITSALKRDQYHVLHLSGHGTRGGIELEDEDGAPQVASASELAQAIVRSGRPLPLVFLSCCDPVTGEDGAERLAQGLLDGGLSQVVAMQGRVSDRYATELAAHFYGELADVPDAEPAAALAHARRELERERRAALQRGDGGAARAPEYATATILCNGMAQPVIAGGTPQPLKQRAAQPMPGPVPQLGVDELVGRKVLLRETLRVLRAPAQHVAGAPPLAGVVLCGMGGVGKSSVAGRIMARLAGEGWLTAATAGSLDLQALTAAVAAALDELDDDRARRLAGQLGEKDADDGVRVSRLSRALRDHRLLLVLDNFEDNLVPGGGEFTEPATGALLDALLRGAVAGRILITSRYPVPGDEPSLRRIDVVSLRSQQGRKLLLRLPGLAQLDRDAAAELLRLSDGHPRLLELVDAALRGDAGRLTAMSARLRELTAELDIDLSVPRGSLRQSTAEAVDLCLLDIALSELIALLSPLQHDLLMQVATSNLPVSADGATAMLAGDDDAVTTDCGAVGAALHGLVERSLVSPIGEHYYVQRWTAQGLKRHDDPTRWRMRNLSSVAHRDSQPPLPLRDRAARDRSTACSAARRVARG